tara:strand:+ start:67 stop:399 length:333 start_codon:yes stop_codon:yes gene_type:complete
VGVRMNVTVLAATAINKITMDKFDLKKYLAEGKLLKEQGPDKFIGKYKGIIAMYIDDEGNKYIKDKNTRYKAIDIEDGEGNPRDDWDIKQDIIQAQKVEKIGYKSDYGKY